MYIFISLSCIYLQNDYIQLFVIHTIVTKNRAKTKLQTKIEARKKRASIFNSE